MKIWATLFEKQEQMYSSIKPFPFFLSLSLNLPWHFYLLFSVILGKEKGQRFKLLA